MPGLISQTATLQTERACPPRHSAPTPGQNLPSASNSGAASAGADVARWNTYASNGAGGNPRKQFSSETEAGLVLHLTAVLQSPWHLSRSAMTYSSQRIWRLLRAWLLDINPAFCDDPATP